MLRFPLPFNVGQTFSSDSIDEKLRSEAATYLWLRKYCPSIPIPRLLGVGFPGAQSLTSIENESIWNRIRWLFKRSMAWWLNETLAPYWPHCRESLTNHGYLLIEYVEKGEMLWTSWKQNRSDENRRTNLYRGLARIMLDLAGLTQPRIGSWTLDNRGILSLTNRPLSDLTFFWNRHQVPTGVPRNLTYTSTEPFVHDVLQYHGLRLQHQPNAILSKNDGIFQLSALTALSSLLPQFWNQTSRQGPLVFAFNDMHQSNIFVDDEWNITSLIDLEFASVKPIQMTRVPSWLANCGVDEIEGAKLEEYERLYRHFIDILEEEEKIRRAPDIYSNILRQNWKSGRHWYTTAVESLNAFPAVFEQHLQPRFYEKFDLDGEGMALARLWSEDVCGFIETKLEDNERYRGRVKQIFAERGEKKDCY